MNVKLKPCPFCGGKAILDTYPMVPYEIYNIPDNDGNWHYVWCDDCQAQTADEPSIEEAVNAWNNRV